MTFTTVSSLADGSRRRITIEADDAESAIEAAELLIAEDTCVAVVDVELA